MIYSAIYAVLIRLIGRKRAMIRDLGLSKIFWAAMAVTYFFLVLAMYAILTLPESAFDADNAEHVMAGSKIDICEARDRCCQPGGLSNHFVQLFKIRQICYNSTDRLGDCCLH